MKLDFTAKAMVNSTNKVFELREKLNYVMTSLVSVYATTLGKTGLRLVEQFSKHLHSVEGFVYKGGSFSTAKQ